MSKKLTLVDRYNLNIHTRNMPCTLMLRLNVDDFLNKIEITDDEVEKYEVKIDPETHQITSNNNEYTVEFDDFSKAIVQSMKNYISAYDHEANKENQFIQKAFKYFKKVI